MITIKKQYTDLPFSHRQPRHTGKCAWIHGHNWGFDFTFAATELDENGFVIDFGRLKFLKTYLQKKFDHTFVVPVDDPEMQLWESLRDKNLIDLVVLPDVSAEGLAQFLLDDVNKLIMKESNNRVFVVEVTVWEDEKNSATASGSFDIVL